MKDILFIRANPVNPDSRVEKEVNSLLKHGYQVTVLGWDRDTDYKIKKEELTLNDGTAVIYRVGIKSTYGSGIKNMVPLGRFQIEIAKFLLCNRKRFDVVHACDFDTAFAAFHMIDHKRTRFVYDVFDYYIEAMRVPKKIKPFIESLDHRLINKADATIICTEQRKQQIYGTTPKNLTVIHNSPPTIENKGMPYTTDSTKMKIAYFGIFSANGRMIREMLDIVSASPEYELHIGGFGAINDIVASYGERFPNIRFYGRVPYDEVLRIESQCDVLTALYDPTIPNHYYAAPNKFYESLMLGKPVIMAKNTGMSDVVRTNDIGCVIDYDIDSLKAGFEYLWNRKKDWKEMSRRMMSLYKERYSWNTMEKRLVELYERICGEENGSYRSQCKREQTKEG